MADGKSWAWVGSSEAEPFWTDFLRSLMRRRLRVVKLVISDAHEGLKAAACTLCVTPWPISARNSAAMVAALLSTVFAQDSRAECHQQWRLVADQLREKYPKIEWTAARMKYWLAWPSLKPTVSSYTAPTRLSG